MGRYLWIMFMASLFFETTAVCQTKKDSDFSLIYLSNTIHYDANALSTQITSQKSLEAIKTLVRKKITDVAGLIVVAFKRDGTFYRWERRLGTVTEDKETEWIVMGRRGTENPIFYSVSQLKQLLKDTIIILDTLALTIHLKSVNYSGNAFKLRMPCNGDTIISPLIVDSSGQLLLTQMLLPPNCDMNIRQPAVFYHGNSPKVPIAKFVLFFPTEEMKTEWQGIAAGMLASGRYQDADKIADLLQSYLQAHYGYCSIQQINRLLLNHH